MDSCATYNVNQMHIQCTLYAGKRGERRERGGREGERERERERERGERESKRERVREREWGKPEREGGVKDNVQDDPHAFLLSSAAVPYTQVYRVYLRNL